MPSRAVLFALVATFFTGSAASAQERPRIGLGIGLATFTVVGWGSHIYVPIRTTPRFIIEPSFGLQHFDCGNGTGCSETRAQLGAGALFVVSSTEDGDVYLGPRAGLTLDDQEGDDRRIHLNIAGVVGGEYFLRRNFSLGGEVGMNYVALDEPDRSALHTVTEFRMRWYFR